MFCGFPRMAAQVKQLESCVGRLRMAVQAGAATQQADMALCAFLRKNDTPLHEVPSAAALDSVIEAMERAGLTVSSPPLSARGPSAPPPPAFDNQIISLLGAAQEVREAYGDALAKHLNGTCIRTSELLSAALKSGTEEGDALMRQMQSGQIVTGASAIRLLNSTMAEARAGAGCARRPATDAHGARNARVRRGSRRRSSYRGRRRQ